ncbi:MAG: hypothetical protein AAFX96_13375, partial [Pseudomonadota bacterium]
MFGKRGGNIDAPAPKPAEAAPVAATAPAVPAVESKMVQAAQPKPASAGFGAGASIFPPRFPNIFYSCTVTGYSQ